jgi:hypothetical protein
MSIEVVHLNLDGLPVFVSTPMFCCIDTDIENALKPLSDTYSRVRCASRFLQRFGASVEFLNVMEDERLIMWGGYLRAALMEYAGMEDSVRSDLRRLGVRESDVVVDKTGNALLILLRELRNLHVHVVQNAFDIRHKNAVLRSLNENRDERLSRSLGQEDNSDTSVITIPRLDLDQLIAARGSRRFDRAELLTAIDWLDDVQHRWGVRDVVLAAIEQYSEIIVRAIPAGAA